MIWCEHCQSHYPTNHYPNGQHGIGFYYGRFGASLFAEQIVRALAERAAPIDETGGDYCLLCGIAYPPNKHYESCPWRQAREWVTKMTDEESA